MEWGVACIGVVGWLAAMWLSNTPHIPKVQRVPVPHPVKEHQVTMSNGRYHFETDIAGRAELTFNQLVTEARLERGGAAFQSVVWLQNGVTVREFTNPYPKKRGVY